MNMPLAARADISPCGRYRYTLERAWAMLPRYVLWLMLNPSTADANRDDATIRRCRNFAHDWGYTGILVGNLYAWRATDPRELGKTASPVGPENDQKLRGLINRAALVVCAWGQPGPDPRRHLRVIELIEECRQEPHVLKLNAPTTGGIVHPGHPCRLASKLVPLRWHAGQTERVNAA